MRTHVSKVLIGVATKNIAATDDLTPLTAPVGAVIAFDWETRTSIVAATKIIGFAKGTAVIGQPITAGPFPKDLITSAIVNPYKAAVNKKITLTVSAVPTVGKTAIIKVTYHDNLSIIPNQIKQTAIAVTANATNAATTATWAAAIAAEFNKQTGANLFVTVTSSTNTVVFEGITLTTASGYNGIDRPESLNFEVGAPDDAALGTYTQVVTTPLSLGQGDPAKMAWLEDQHMGRLGYSDRRSWNDGKKYQSQVVAGQTYATLVINGNVEVEGDMQGTYKAPVGVIIGGSSASVAVLVTDLATAGIVVTTVAAG